MFFLLKLYLSGTKIHYRDIHLVYRTIAYKIGFFVVLGLGTFIVYLLKISNKQGIHIFEDIVSIPSYVVLLWVVILPLVLGVGVEFAFEKLFPDKFRQYQHRQRIARLIVDNGWYRSEKETKEFVEMPEIFKREQEKITYFPKMFYRMKNGKVYITVEIPTGKLREPLLHLDKELETGLFCELVDEELKEFYKEYVFLYDVICNRISIEDVKVENGKMLLMKGMYWEFDDLPHALICGGTGGGKTYFILTLIEALLKSGAELSVLDPKRADLADLADVMPNVYFMPDDMIEELKKFYEKMMERTAVIKQMDNYKTGVNYAYVGMQPHFLVLDEYVAFVEMVGRKKEEVLNYMKQIAMLGRQVGCFLILACQRPDAKYFADGIRDQFNLRIALGRNSEMGYAMMFGSECKKEFFNKRIKGRGYADTGTSVITEFYSPFVPKGYDFLKNIREMNLLENVKKEECMGEDNHVPEVDAEEEEDF